MPKVYLGIDVGSVSTNIITMNEAGDVLSAQYIRTNGQPLECVKAGLRQIGAEFKNSDVIGVGATGSGRQLAGIITGADIVKNEITAHATAAIDFYPQVRTIFEIGGQDSKIILIKNRMIVDFAMNTVCAAGTGSFLDHQAERLKIPIEQFGTFAATSTKETRIAGRCTVFAESDMIAKQQFGFSKGDIIKGLCEALVRNYINNLGRGKALEPPFVFQGGVAANQGIIEAFKKELQHEIIIPRYFNVMGAIGAALLARSNREKTGFQTGFTGFETVNIDFVPNTFQCNDCPNVCEVIEVAAGERIVARWGDKCGKWTAVIAGNQNELKEGACGMAANV